LRPEAIPTVEQTEDVEFVMPEVVLERSAVAARLHHPPADQGRPDPIHASEASSIPGRNPLLFARIRSRLQQACRVANLDQIFWKFY
jgi:hypothetical protein